MWILESDYQANTEAASMIGWHPNEQATFAPCCEVASSDGDDSDDASSVNAMSFADRDVCIVCIQTPGSLSKRRRGRSRDGAQLEQVSWPWRFCRRTIFDVGHGCSCKFLLRNRTEHVFGK